MGTPPERHATTARITDSSCQTVSRVSLGALFRTVGDEGDLLEYLLRRPRGELRRERCGRGSGVGRSQDGRLPPPRPSLTRRRQRNTQQQPSTHSAALASAAMVMPSTRPRCPAAQDLCL